MSIDIGVEPATPGHPAVAFRVPAGTTLVQLHYGLPEGEPVSHRTDPQGRPYVVHMVGGRVRTGCAWRVAGPRPIPRPWKKPFWMSSSDYVHVHLRPWLGSPNSQVFHINVAGTEWQRLRQVAAFVSKETGLPRGVFQAVSIGKITYNSWVTVTVPCCRIDATIDGSDTRFEVRMYTADQLAWQDCEALMRLDAEPHGVGPLLRVEWPAGHFADEQLQFPAPVVVARPLAVYAHATTNVNHQVAGHIAKEDGGGAPHLPRLPGGLRAPPAAPPRGAEATSRPAAARAHLP